jgi:hypothetical protein
LNWHDRETRITLPHPFDASRDMRVSSSSLNSHRLVRVKTFMTSKQLDAFCSNGKYCMGC